MAVEQFTRFAFHGPMPMPRKQKFPHLLGSKWTAQHQTEGWRHFRVANRKQEGNWVFAELVAACDSTVRFWINAKQLKNPTLWQAGWQPLGQKSNQDPLEESEEP